MQLLKENICKFVDLCQHNRVKRKFFVLLCFYIRNRYGYFVAGVVIIYYCNIEFYFILLFREGAD